MVFKGIWLFGLSGVGKTFLSKQIKKKKINSLIIDGDDVRKYVSHDLLFSIGDRSIQCKRLYGIAQIVMKNNFFPIISSAYLSNEIREKLKKKKILVVKVVRKKEDVLKSITYKKFNKNIVGKDIFYQKFKYLTFKNNQNYKKNLSNLLEKINF